MRYTVLLLLLFAAALVRAQTEPLVADTVEEMPLFLPTCPEQEAYYLRKKCSDKAMLVYLYERIKYPTAARKANQEGVAVVSVVVDAEGKISRTFLYRDPGYGLGTAALAAVNRMVEEGVQWEPGRNDGEAVAVELKIPIKFALGK